MLFKAIKSTSGSKLEMRQYDTDVPAQGPPLPVNKHFVKNEIKKGILKSHDNLWILPLIEPDVYFMINIPVYKIWIQYSNLFKRYRTETIFRS